MLSLTRRVLPGPAPIEKRQKRIALAVAAAADLLQLGLAPLFAEGALSPFEGALDLVVALSLALIVGFRWRTLLAFGLELVPGLALFPSWTAVVLTLPSASTPPDRKQIPPGRALRP
jgi:hypothetical protein